MQDEPLYDVIFYRIERTIRKAREYSKRIFKELGYDLTVEQWVLLKKVAEQEGLTQREISDQTYKEPAAITRTLDVLVKKQLVQRTPHPTDRRSFGVYLTLTGKTTYEALLPHVVAMREQSIKHLSKEALQQLKQGLDQIYDNL